MQRPVRPGAVRLSQADRRCPGTIRAISSAHAFVRTFVSFVCQGPPVCGRDPGALARRRRRCLPRDCLAPAPWCGPLAVQTDRIGALASAPAGARATAAPTPVGWRESKGSPGPQPARKSRGRGRFDKGTLVMAQIGPMRAGQKPARSPRQRTGHRPLSNPPLRPVKAHPPSPVPADTGVTNVT